jgi:hypothetical protein
MAVSLGGDTPTYRIVRFAASALPNHLPEMAKVELRAPQKRGAFFLPSAKEKAALRLDPKFTALIPHLPRRIGSLSVNVLVFFQQSPDQYLRFIG